MFRRRWSALHDRLVAALGRAARTNAVAEAIADAFRIGGPVALLVVAATSAADGARPLVGSGPGAVVGLAAMAAAALLPLGSLAINIRSIAEMGSVVDHLTDLAHAPAEQPVRGPLPGEITGALSLRGVGFRYAARSPWILQDISVDVPAGGKLAIVGSSGSGKSTLAVDLRPVRTDRGCGAAGRTTAAVLRPAGDPATDGRGPAGSVPALRHRAGRDRAAGAACPVAADSRGGPARRDPRRDPRPAKGLPDVAGRGGRRAVRRAAAAAGPGPSAAGPARPAGSGRGHRTPGRDVGGDDRAQPPAPGHDQSGGGAPAVDRPRRRPGHRAGVRADRRTGPAGRSAGRRRPLRRPRRHPGRRARRALRGGSGQAGRRRHGSRAAGGSPSAAQPSTAYRSPPQV